MTLVGRFVRGRRLDDNPLRRASDRAETLVLMVLLAVFLVAAPLATPASGARAHAMAQRAQAAQAASRYQVTAVVLTVASRPIIAYGDYVSEAKARWTAPDGAVVTSQALVAAGTRAEVRSRLTADPPTAPHTASSSRSPVRTRSAPSTGQTQILPSPMAPVLADLAIVSAIASASSS
jgi:hypothetical protein